MTIVKPGMVTFEASETKPDLISESSPPPEPMPALIIPQLELEPMLGLCCLSKGIERELKFYSSLPQYTYFRHRIKPSNAMPVMALQMPNVQNVLQYCLPYLMTAADLQDLMKKLPAEINSDAYRMWMREVIADRIKNLCDFPLRENKPSQEFTHTIRRINLSIEECFTNDETFIGATGNLKKGLERLTQFIYPYADSASLLEDADSYITPIFAFAEELKYDKQLFHYKGWKRDDPQSIIIIPRKT